MHKQVQSEYTHILLTPCLTNVQKRLYIDLTIRDPEPKTDANNH